jgi:hypothetical protein
LAGETVVPQRSARAWITYEPLSGKSMRVLAPFTQSTNTDDPLRPVVVMVMVMLPSNSP